jgi:hypothetical protein
LYCANSIFSSHKINPNELTSDVQKFILNNLTLWQNKRTSEGFINFLSRINKNSTFHQKLSKIVSSLILNKKFIFNKSILAHINTSKELTHYIQSNHYLIPKRRNLISIELKTSISVIKQKISDGEITSATKAISEASSFFSSEQGFCWAQVCLEFFYDSGKNAFKSKLL